MTRPANLCAANDDDEDSDRSIDLVQTRPVARKEPVASASMSVASPGAAAAKGKDKGKGPSVNNHHPSRPEVVVHHQNNAAVSGNIHLQQHSYSQSTIAVAANTNAMHRQVLVQRREVVDAPRERSPPLKSKIISSHEKSSQGSSAHVIPQEDDNYSYIGQPIHLGPAHNPDPPKNLPPWERASQAKEAAKAAFVASEQRKLIEARMKTRGETGFGSLNQSIPPPPPSKLPSPKKIVRKSPEKFSIFLEDPDAAEESAVVETAPTATAAYLKNLGSVADRQGGPRNSLGGGGRANLLKRKSLSNSTNDQLGFFGPNVVEGARPSFNTTANHSNPSPKSAVKINKTVVGPASSKTISRQSPSPKKTLEASLPKSPPRHHQQESLAAATGQDDEDVLYLGPPFISFKYFKKPKVTNHIQFGNISLSSADIKSASGAGGGGSSGPLVKTNFASPVLERHSMAPASNSVAVPPKLGSLKRPDLGHTSPNRSKDLPVGTSHVSTPRPLSNANATLATTSRGAAAGNSLAQMIRKRISTEPSLTPQRNNAVPISPRKNHNPPPAQVYQQQRARSLSPKKIPASDDSIYKKQTAEIALQFSESEEEEDQLTHDSVRAAVGAAAISGVLGSPRRPINVDDEDEIDELMSSPVQEKQAEPHLSEDSASSKEALPEIFEVERILDYENTDTGDWVNVKWKGYPDTDNTWEKWSQMKDFNCQGALQEYWKRLKVKSFKVTGSPLLKRGKGSGQVALASAAKRVKFSSSVDEVQAKSPIASRKSPVREVEKDDDDVVVITSAKVKKPSSSGIPLSSSSSNPSKSASSSSKTANNTHQTEA